MTSELFIEIAGINFKLVCENTGIIKSFTEMYSKFKTKSAIQNYTFHIIIENMDNLIDKTKLSKYSVNDWDTNLIYTSNYNSKKRIATLITSISNAYFTIEHFLLKMTNKILIENNMLLFHSATLIDKDKNSYILYGPSCIGKSTISNNSSLQVISDDLLIIKPMKDNCYEFFKTPFTRDKSNTINKLENVKIAGLYRLKQSTNEHFEKMNQSVSFAELIGNIPDLHSQIHNEKLLQLVKNLSSKIPNHYLYFTKSSIFEQIIN